MRLIGPAGEQLGVMPPELARAKALDQGLDLVEVDPTAEPPVCRIMDHGKHAYKEQKKHAHKPARARELKELRLGFKIGRHDLDIKVRRAKEFLEEGHRVQFTMVYKGREITHMDLGEQIMKGVVASLADASKIERHPFREGKRVGMVLAPK